MQGDSRPGRKNGPCPSVVGASARRKRRAPRGDRRARRPPGEPARRRTTVRPSRSWPGSRGRRLRRPAAAGTGRPTFLPTPKPHRPRVDRSRFALPPAGLLAHRPGKMVGRLHLRLAREIFGASARRIASSCEHSANVTRAPCVSANASRAQPRARRGRLRPRSLRQSTTRALRRRFHASSDRPHGRRSSGKDTEHRSCRTRDRCPGRDKPTTHPSASPAPHARGRADPEPSQETRPPRSPARETPRQRAARAGLRPAAPSARRSRRRSPPSR